jgi:outer membrane biosynthesis protein TonB
MGDSRAAVGMDRLPWLDDEPEPRSRRGGVELAAWAAAAVALVAGASYWMGARSHRPEPAQTVSVAPKQAVTVPLPSAEAPPQKEVQLQPQPEVAPVPQPEVHSTPQREVPIERPRAVKRIVVTNPEAPAEEQPAEAASAATSTTGAQPAAPPAAQPATPVERPLKPWPAWQSAGADGRIVRIGSFGSRLQAKLGWHYMVQAYPAVAHLKATVVADRNSRGRHFYRFQIGTTSQAHSEVLCQRMEKIHLSCAVVGLPWKPKGVER